MADQPALLDLLDRTGKVFKLAHALASSFVAEREHRGIVRYKLFGGPHVEGGRTYTNGDIVESPLELDRMFVNKFERLADPPIFDPAAAWSRCRPTFNDFLQLLLTLREAMQHAPDGFAAVAEQLKRAADIVRRLQKVMPDSEAFLDFPPDLNSVSLDGWKAIEEFTKARRLDDPFEFLDKSADSSTMNQPLTKLEEYPATPVGHLGFLEFVRDEVHYTADAKRQQLVRGYSNDTLAGMVRGIKWDEARARLFALPDLQSDATEQVARILAWQLTVGTVEQIDELLQPAVRALRNRWEAVQFCISRGLPTGSRNTAADVPVVVQTAGDLWKALSEGKKVGVTVSSIAIPPPSSGINCVELTFPDADDQQRHNVVDRALALVDAEGGDRADAMKKLIARVAIQWDISLAAAINLPLANFVEELIPSAATGSGRALEKAPLCLVKAAPEPTLDVAEYERILRILRNMSLMIERNPGTFAALDEEKIRDHFLLQLNGQYEGAATGETFNGCGKTDILVRIVGRNIFIAECKFWRGSKEFNEAIDQLLRYLTWRDCKCALLMFNRTKDTTAVAKKMHAAVEARPEHRRTMNIDADSTARYLLAKADDPGREITVTTMLFDLPLQAPECLPS